MVHSQMANSDLVFACVGLRVVLLLACRRRRATEASSDCVMILSGVGSPFNSTSALSFGS